MIYQLKCKFCGATCWVTGDYESDTLDESRNYKWEPKNSNCEHPGWDIINEEFDPHDLDDL